MFVYTMSRYVIKIHRKTLTRNITKHNNLMLTIVFGSRIYAALTNSLIYTVNYKSPTVECSCRKNKQTPVFILNSVFCSLNWLFCFNLIMLTLRHFPCSFFMLDFYFI